MQNIVYQQILKALRILNKTGNKKNNSKVLFAYFANQIYESKAVLYMRLFKTFKNY